MPRSTFRFGALALCLFLAACDSPEERAEAHYQAALALLEEGDLDRAIVELRNVFQDNDSHLQGRYLLADILLNQNNRVQQAYSQYLRLVEQYPDELDARIALSELAFFSSNWAELDRHGDHARGLAPDDPRVQAVSATIDYRAAIEAEDTSARASVVRAAAELLANDEGNRILREVILDDHLRKQELTSSLTLLNDLTQEFPEEQRYWLQRLQVLLALGDQSAVEEQLVNLVERFPEDAEQKQMLVRYYLSRDELDKVEDFLRQLVADSAEDDIAPRVDLIRFLSERRTPEAARAEITAAVETETNTVPFVMLGAALDFASGNTERAIMDLEESVAAQTEPSDDKSAMQVALARMLLSIGNDVGARALVETVLSEDETNVGALKMNAAWLIEADETDDAVSALRSALDRDPEDVGTLSLMANAYARAGRPELSRDFLSLAVEASGNAPEETVRYAQSLIGEERYLSAEDVLLPALRLAPNNFALLQTAAQLYLAMDDEGRARQAIDTLSQIDSDQARNLVIQLEAQLLSQTGGSEDAIQYLESLAENSDAASASRILLLRARIQTGDFDGAIQIAEGILAEDPDSPGAKLVVANTYSAAGDNDRALAIYRDLAEEFPEDATVQLQIAAMLARTGDPDAARKTIEDALALTPESPRLLWATASYRELDGDIDGAIDIYRSLYALDSSSVVVANNLASLIATYKDDPESLNEAWLIARRFNDVDLPAIQDTYGWIAHRRGDSAEALPYLQSAAAALTNDPVVQFHYAEVLFALDQAEEALEQYRTTLSLAGVGDTRPQFAAARDRVAELEESLANPE